MNVPATLIERTTKAALDHYGENHETPAPAQFAEVRIFGDTSPGIEVFLKSPDGEVLGKYLYLEGQLRQVLNPGGHFREDNDI